MIKRTKMAMKRRKMTVGTPLTTRQRKKRSRRRLISKVRL
jgi:hypothetical protein